MPIICRVVGQVNYLTAIRIHDVDILVPLPVGNKYDLIIIWRPAGHGIVGRMVRELNLLVRVQVEEKDLVVAITVFCECQETSIVRPGRVSMRCRFSRQAFGIS